MVVTFYTHTLFTHKMAEHQSLLRPREANDDAFRLASSSSSKTWTLKVLAGSGAMVLATTLALSGGNKGNSVSSSSLATSGTTRSSHHHRRGSRVVAIIARVQNHQTAHGVRAVARARFPPRPDVVEEKHGRASDCSIATKSRVSVRSRD